MKKVRAKQLELEAGSEELKALRSTTKSQETTLAYFRKKVEEMSASLEEERNEKLALQGELRAAAQRVVNTQPKQESPRYEESSSEQIPGNVT